jgi:hypothetical protein
MMNFGDGKIGKGITMSISFALNSSYGLSHSFVEVVDNMKGFSWYFYLYLRLFYLYLFLW